MALRNIRIRALATIAAALTAFVVAVVANRFAKPSVAESAPKRPAPMRIVWTAGREFRYALHLRSSQRAMPPGGATIDASLALDGDLVVRCHEVAGERARIGLALDRLTRASLVISGAEVLPSASALGGEVLLWVDDHGAIEQALYRRDASDAFRAVIPNVVALTKVSLPREPAVSWLATELTMLGSARSQYVAEDGNPFSLVRHRLGYEALLALPRGASASSAEIESRDSLTLDDDGMLKLAAFSEKVTSGSALSAAIEASLERTATSTFSPVAVALADLEARAPDERSARAMDTEEQRLRQLAGDMTMAKLEALAFAAAPGRQLPPGFVTSAVAMLKLDPGLCAALVEWFERPNASLAARALLLDLLASAGHAKAQAAIRDALASPAARATADGYRLLLQRLGVIVAPDRETVDFAYSSYAHAKGEDRLAAAFALGATLGARGPARADPALAAYGDRLRADLKKARGTDERVALLAALGNAARPADVAAIKTFAHDDDARVRRQAALSLRRDHTTEAQDTLFTMLADGDSSVGEAALQALADEGANAAVVQRLGSMVGTPAFPGALNEPLLTIVGGELQSHPAEARAALEAIAATSHDPHTIARARMLIDQLHS